MLSELKLPVNISFFDPFDRVDSPKGIIGEPPLGGQYYLRGADLISASESKIVNNKWVTPAFSTTYAVQTLPGKVKNIGGKLRWIQGSGNDADALFVFIVSKYGAENIAWVCNHIRVNRYALNFDVRKENKTIYSKTIFFPAPLQFNKDYIFDFDFIYNLVYCNVDGVLSEIIANDQIAEVGGNYASYEFFFNPAPTTTEILVDSIWAGNEI